MNTDEEAIFVASIRVSDPAVEGLQATVAPVAVPAESQPSALAGVGLLRRTPALIIDLALHLGVAALAGALFAFMAPVLIRLAHVPVAGVLSGATEPRLLSLAFQFMGRWAYHGTCEWICGSTLGKLILGIAVVQEDGSPCTLAAAARRSLGRVVDEWFFGLSGAGKIHASPRKQRAGDTWAHTLVIRRRDLPAGTRQPLWVFLMALFAGIVLDGFVLLLENILWMAWAGWRYS